MTWLRNLVAAHVGFLGRCTGVLLGERESHFNCKVKTLHSMRKREPLSTGEMPSLVLTKILTFQLDFSGNCFAVPI